MVHLHVKVFGKIHILNDQVVVDVFPTRRVEELLAYLVLNPKARHPREKLIATLWPDVALSNGRASLSTALWRLRSVFDRIGVPAETYIQANREWVSFDPGDTFQLDLTLFEGYLAEAERSADGCEREKALRAALALYAGALCDGIYAEWCLLERERLERRYLRGLGQLMACLIQRRLFSEAVSVGRQILQHDPLREEVHRAIMHCYWQMGERAQAVRQFQNCARLLQAELQILPMPETINLYRQVIEDRLDDLMAREAGRDQQGLENELQQAYREFLVAAQALNTLIETSEKVEFRGEPEIIA